MSLALALALSLLAVPQSDLPGNGMNAATISGPGRTWSALPMGPAEIVAVQVRSVLQNQDDARAWQRLAGALPEFALSGEADLEATLAAARIAEESGPATRPSVPGEPVDKEASSGIGAIALTVLRRLDVELLGTVIALLSVAGVMLHVTRDAPHPKPRRSTRAAEAPTLMGEVLALASDGLPIAEIARRTGTSRDAVAVLMRVGGR